MKKIILIIFTLLNVNLTALEYKYTLDGCYDRNTCSTAGLSYLVNNDFKSRLLNFLFFLFIAFKINKGCSYIINLCVMSIGFGEHDW